MTVGLVRRGHSRTGGAEAYLLRLADALAEAGHRPVLITSAAWPEDRWSHGAILRIGGGTPDAFARGVRESETGCDVHLSLERVPGCEVFRAGDGVHAAWLERRRAFEPWWKQWLRWTNRKHAELLALEKQVFSPDSTRIVIANSRLVADEIEAHFGFPRERIRVIPNGLRACWPSVDRSAARQRFGLDDSTLAVLFVGSGWERKGLDTAVRAVEKLRDARLLVAGRGPSRHHARVDFLGPTSELGTLFAAADVFALPTWYDPYSNACLEALSAGLPVVTTPANGFSESIDEGVHGSLVSPGDATALATALEGWRGRRPEVAEACVRRAAEFSIEKNAALTIAVLDEARRMTAG